MSFILPGALRRRQPPRGGGDSPTCAVREGSRDGVAFLNPEGKKTLLLTDHLSDEKNAKKISEVLKSASLRVLTSLN